MAKLGRQRRMKKYNYSKDRRKQNLKNKKKAVVAESSLKREWNDNKSIRYNMESMGLSYDPNNAVSKGKANKACATAQHLVKLEDKTSVRKELEEKAAIPEALQLRLSEPDTQYIIYMIEKYGEDYKAMARDRRNYYQDTPKQIRKKVLTFQKIPNLYDAYKLMKEQKEDADNQPS